jgi:hypothetical protein
MIPKVAANLLHASKAAGPLPSLPAYLRNVLQLQGAAATPTTGAGASTSIGWGGATSSSWGGNAGAGGAKFNAGSKFYAGYTVSATLSSVAWAELKLTCEYIGPRKSDHSSKLFFVAVR